MRYVLAVLKTVLNVLLLSCPGLQISIQIRLGVISQPCTDTFVYVNETRLQTVSDSINLTTIVYWKYVTGNELYQMAKIVSELKSADVEACIFATDHDRKYIEQMFRGSNIRVTDFDMMETRRSTVSPTDVECEIRVKLIANNPDLLCAPPVVSNGKTVSKVVNGSHHVSVIVASTLKYLNWKTVLLLHESKMEKQMDGIRQYLSDFGTIVHYEMVDNYTSTEYHQLIDALSQWDHALFLYVAAICSTECSAFVEAMNSYDSQNPRQRALRHFSEIMVFVITKEVSQFYPDMANSTLDNVVFLSLPMTLPYSGALSHDEFESLIHILTRNADLTKSSPSAYKETMSSHILQQVHQLQASKRCQWFPIETLMWTSSGRGFRNVGYVDVNGELLLFSSLFPNKDYGLNGRHFIVSTVEWFPFVQKLPNGSYDGLSFDIFNEIADRFNFTYEITVPPNGEWGLQLEDGNWTGSIGQLQRKEIDFMVASLTVHSAREQVMDFTQPYYYDSTIILMTKENPSKTKWRTLIEPFDDTVLLCIGCSLLVASVLLFVFEKISPYNAISGDLHTGNEFITYQDSLWYMYGALLTQGGDRLPSSFTGRTMLSCWWLFCLVMMASYSGNLIAFLTVSKDKLPFESVAEMIQQNDYKWGVIGGSYWVTIFKRSILPEFKAVWEGVVRFNVSDPSVLSSDPTKHIQKVLDEDYAYLGDKTQIEMKMANACVLQTGKEEILPFQYAFGLPNNSPFTKMISEELIEIHESGLLSKWKSRRWPKVNNCSGDQTTSAKAIILMDVQSAFYLIGIGISLATLVLLVEKVINSWKNRKSKEKGDIS